jgi:hypothetical protein
MGIYRSRLRDTIQVGDKRIDARDIETRIEELEMERKPWVAGWNMPGYMPDSEPASFETCDDAREYIGQEMLDASEALPDGEEYDERRNALHDTADAMQRLAETAPDSEYGETVGGHHYWISKAENEGLDEDDYKELVMWREAMTEIGRDDGLIHESDWEDYARELASDCCDMKRTNQWPFTCIDWEKAARELAVDYSQTEIGGETYYVDAR